MNPTDARAEAIFQAALALSGQAERETLISAECGDDLALEMRVRRLLREHEDADASPEDAALAPEIEGDTPAYSRLLRLGAHWAIKLIAS